MPTIHVNGINLYYEENGTGQPLVLIHGLGSSTRDWEAQVQAFCQRYRVVAFDLRGHGRSDKPAGPYTVSLFAADAAGLLKALGIESAHIVGISLGGSVAFQFAIDYPAMVKTLTIVNSAPGPFMAAEQFKQEVDRRVGIVRQMGMPAMGQALAPNLFPKPEHASLRQDFITHWAENDPRAYVDATLSLLGWDVVDRLGTIHAPTLIIAADQDYSPVALKEAYVKQMPNAELVVISDSHHATPIEQPDKFNAALRQFLDKHS